LLCNTDLTAKYETILEGESLELNCSLDCSPSVGFDCQRLNSSRMSFVVIFASNRTRKTIDSRYYRTDGPHTLLLVHPNISMKDTGTYHCGQMNETSFEWLGSIEIIVGSKKNVKRCLSFIMAIYSFTFRRTMACTRISPQGYVRSKSE
jgi:hypothetical protein